MRRMTKRSSGDKSGTRIERDSMGEMPVPAHVLYGASTQRAVLNFPISGRPVPARVIHAFAMLKKASAEANLELDNTRPDFALLEQLAGTVDDLQLTSAQEEFRKLLEEWKDPNYDR